MVPQVLLISYFAKEKVKYGGDNVLLTARQVCHRVSVCIYLRRVQRACKDKIRLKLIHTKIEFQIGSMVLGDMQMCKQSQGLVMVIFRRIYFLTVVINIK